MLLKARSHAEKSEIGPFESPCDHRHAGHESQGAKERNGSPHYGKCRGSRNHPAIFAGMKALKQDLAIKRTIAAWVCEVDEMNSPGTIKPPHKRDFSATQRAAAIEPDIKPRLSGRETGTHQVPNILKQHPRYCGLRITSQHEKPGQIRAVPKD